MLQSFFILLFDLVVVNFAQQGHFNRNCTCNEIQSCLNTKNDEWQTCHSRCSALIPVAAEPCFNQEQSILKNIVEIVANCVFDPEVEFNATTRTRRFNEAPPSQNIQGLTSNNQREGIWHHRRSSRSNGPPELQAYQDCRRNCSKNKNNTKSEEDEGSRRWHHSKERWEARYQRGIQIRRGHNIGQMFKDLQKCATDNEYANIAVNLLYHRFPKMILQSF